MILEQPGIGDLVVNILGGPGSPRMLVVDLGPGIAVGHVLCAFRARATGEVWEMAQPVVTLDIVRRAAR